MSYIEILKRAGISIPKGATSFHVSSGVSGALIIFNVNDFPDGGPIQGSHWEEAALSRAQVEILAAANCCSTLGWELEVADSHGYQG